MIKFRELSDPNSCMSRAKDHEMTFVLLARDKAAPVAIRAWVAERIRLGKNTFGHDPQIEEALSCAKSMEEQSDTVSPKAAEAPGGQDEPETIEFIRTVLEWERDYRRINNLAGGGPDWVNWGEDLLQASETCQDCGHLPCDCAPAAPSERADAEQLTIADYEECLADKRRLVRELDVIWNGDDAAVQASLCDLVSQIADELPKLRAGLSSQEGK